jgi:hypothetical protein
MRHHARIAALALTVVAVFACNTNERTGKTDDGGIILSISSFDGLPISISASQESQTGSTVTVGEIVVTSIVKSPSQPTSQLMTVEMDSYEVTYQRADLGTRVPPRLKNFLLGSVPAGGTFTLNNGPILRIDQFEEQPIEDMLDLGYDSETTSTVIRLKVGIQFFGRTIAGDIVETAPGYFTLDIVP